MSLSAEFNASYPAHRENDYVLRVTSGPFLYYYDFMARMLVTLSYAGSASMTTTPFSQVDRETLITMRDTLVELKGKPPELPPEAPATAMPIKKLNL